MSREPGIRALDFMLGEWILDYRITQRGNTSRDLCGTGSVQRLFDTYVTFDYQVRLKDSGKDVAQAHGVFTWDQKAGLYRYYWFESTGSCRQATGTFSDEDTLALEWEGIECSQIFRRIGPDALYLEMTCPAESLVLRVDFTRVPVQDVR